LLAGGKLPVQQRSPGESARRCASRRSRPHAP
jgi:hypothetical protein